MPYFDPIEAIAVAFPIFVILLVTVALVYRTIWPSSSNRKHPAKHRRRMSIAACNALIGFAFLPLSIIYRPSLREVAKAQIRQQEDVDEDQSGDPESPLKHLLRQLRRIRRGEVVETISLRLR